MNFKKGDKVILTGNKKSQMPESMVGEEFVITSTEVAEFMWDIRIRAVTIENANKSWWLHPDELELSIIRDSPLYKALL